MFLFLDEVQESSSWETELKSLYDSNNLKIFCSGSTSALIQSQGGKLTGRQIVNRVDLLSFAEFIDFRGGRPLPSEDYKFERLADEYLTMGGYPENALRPSTEYLSNLIDDILFRDIVRLFRRERTGSGFRDWDKPRAPSHRSQVHLCFRQRRPEIRLP